ncbi:MAG: bifunctional phosphopantothenoylcysteine decarboxylase/phosphopantothenate--cysteine ligase CoaBC [Eggerthellaceae bacterium]|nr:bifunctional phosphopantothenoylcysteine decarboxylase/phosphopantothenate--cysteine ligase CoaBC [Eggerthellaceae bacterium]
MSKTVLIGVTGCVAIYKTCEIIRGLQKGGVRAKVVMTESATHFINPTLFRSLTREPVAVGLFDDAPGDPIHHVSLAKEADLFLIAPCTANVMAKMAHGIADDLLTTTALATTAPIVIAPAMNVNMYENVATQQNMETLRSRGIEFVDAESGYLACGDEGKGRLADPAVIVKAVLDRLNVKRDLEGKRVLVTAGPTVEPIDAVRFISNPSSGKMGFAIAVAAHNRGADVTLVTGPVSLEDPAGIETVHVKTALEMFDAVESAFGESDIAIFTAAVSDYRPASPVERKLKKGADDAALETLELVENPDILATMASRKRPDQLVVGFAAETENVEANARKKLVGKKADLIVGNLVSHDNGFAIDENEAMLVDARASKELPRMTKAQLACAILDELSLALQ